MRKLILFGIALILLIPILSLNVYSTIFLEGRIVDSETGQPINDDIIEVKIMSRDDLNRVYSGTPYQSEYAVYQDIRDTVGRDKIYTSSDGVFKFEFDNRWAGNNLVLRFSSSSGYSSFGEKVTLPQREQRINLGDIRHFVEFEGKVLPIMEVSPATVKGRVVDPFGSPISGANVNLNSFEYDENIIANNFGEFKFSVVSTGIYSLKISNLGYHDYNDNVQVRTGARDLVGEINEFMITDRNLGDISLFPTTPVPQLVQNEQIIQKSFSGSFYVKREMDFDTEYFNNDYFYYQNFKVLGGTIYYSFSLKFSYKSGFRAALKDGTKINLGSPTGDLVTLNYNSAYDDGSGRCSRAVIKNNKNEGVKLLICKTEAITSEPASTTPIIPTTSNSPTSNLQSLSRDQVKTSDFASIDGKAVPTDLTKLGCKDSLSIIPGVNAPEGFEISGDDFCIGKNGAFKNRECNNEDNCVLSLAHLFDEDSGEIDPEIFKNVDLGFDVDAIIHGDERDAVDGEINIEDETAAVDEDKQNQIKLIMQAANDAIKMRDKLVSDVEAEFGITPMFVFGWLDENREEKIILSIITANDIGKKFGLSPGFITAAAFQEGLNTYVVSYYINPTIKPGFEHLGLDYFHAEINDLKRDGFLRDDFSEYSSEGKVLFNDLQYALEAFVAVLAQRRAHFLEDAGKLGYDINSISERQLDYWTYVYYNCGRSCAQNRIKNGLEISDETGRAPAPGQASTDPHWNAKRTLSTIELISRADLFGDAELTLNEGNTGSLGCPSNPTLIARAWKVVAQALNAGDQRDFCEVKEQSECEFIQEIDRKISCLIGKIEDKDLSEEQKIKYIKQITDVALNSGNEISESHPLINVLIPLGDLLKDETLGVDLRNETLSAMIGITYIMPDNHINNDHHPLFNLLNDLDKQVIRKLNTDKEDITLASELRVLSLLTYLFDNSFLFQSPSLPRPPISTYFLFKNLKEKRQDIIGRYGMEYYLLATARSITYSSNILGQTLPSQEPPFNSFSLFETTELKAFDELYKINIDSFENSPEKMRLSSKVGSLNFCSNAIRFILDTSRLQDDFLIWNCALYAFNLLDDDHADKDTREQAIKMLRKLFGLETSKRPIGSRAVLRNLIEPMKQRYLSEQDISIKKKLIPILGYFASRSDYPNGDDILNILKRDQLLDYRDLESIQDNDFAMNKFVIWSVKEFNQIYNRLSELHPEITSENEKFSISLATMRYLSYLTSDTSRIDEGFKFILDKRSEFAQKELINEDTYLIMITHDERLDNHDRFSNDKIIDFVERIDIDKIADRNLKGPSDKSKFLDLVEESRDKHDVLIWLDGHGSQEDFWLTEGQYIPMQTGNDATLYETGIKISFRELGDALLKRGKDNLNEVNIFIGACFSYNYATNLFNYLKDKGANSFPTIISITNKNNIGTSCLNTQFSDSCLLNSFNEIYGDKTNQPFTGQDVLNAEKLMFDVQDNAFFLGGKEFIEIGVLDQKGNTQLASNQQSNQVTTSAILSITGKAVYSETAHKEKAATIIKYMKENKIPLTFTGVNQMLDRFRNHEASQGKWDIDKLQKGVYSLLRWDVQNLQKAVSDSLLNGRAGIFIKENGNNFDVDIGKIYAVNENKRLERTAYTYRFIPKEKAKSGRNELTIFGNNQEIGSMILVSDFWDYYENVDGNPNLAYAISTWNKDDYGFPLIELPFSDETVSSTNDLPEGSSYSLIYGVDYSDYRDIEKLWPNSQDRKYFAVLMEMRRQGQEERLKGLIYGNWDKFTDWWKRKYDEYRAFDF